MIEVLKLALVIEEFDSNNESLPLELLKPIAETLRALAQRTWVGLTDEQITQGCKESWVTEQAWQSAVWWAEAILKQNNGFAEENNNG